MKKRKIFVRKLGKTIKEIDLKNYFSKYGKVETVEVLRNFKTQQSRRVAYVIFKDSKSVENVFINEKPHEILGREIECERCLLAEEINPTKPPSLENNSTAYSSNMSHLSNLENGFFMIPPEFHLGPTNLNMYPMMNPQAQINSFSNPIRVAPQMLPCVVNPIYQYTNYQARSVIGGGSLQGNQNHNFNLANTAPVNETMYNRDLAPKTAVNKIAAFKESLKSKNSSSKYSSKLDKLSSKPKVNDDREALIAQLKGSTNFSKPAPLQKNDIFSYRKNIKERKEIVNAGVNNKIISDTVNLIPEPQSKEFIDESYFDTNEDIVLDSENIIRKLSASKFKEDIIDSHKKSFFSTENNYDKSNSNAKTIDDEEADNLLEAINSQALVVDSIFFNNSNNTEKSHKDSDSTSSSEETFDLQIHSSDENEIDAEFFSNGRKQ